MRFFLPENDDLVDEGYDLLNDQYGEVRKATVPTDRETGKKRGFGFVELAKEDQEQTAIDDLQNVEWMGRMIRVNKAEPRR